MRKPLFDQWVVYDHPKDFPHCFVARRHAHAAEENEYYPTEDVVISPDLDTLRQWLARNGLACMPRFENDPPHIVEVWL